MAWRRPGDKPLSEPKMVRLLTRIWVTRPQWVNTSPLKFNTFIIDLVTDSLVTKQYNLPSHLPYQGPHMSSRAELSRTFLQVFPLMAPASWQHKSHNAAPAPGMLGSPAETGRHQSPCCCPGDLSKVLTPTKDNIMKCMRVSNCIPQCSVGCNFLFIPGIPASGTKVLIYYLRLVFGIHINARRSLCNMIVLDSLRPGELGHHWFR